MIDYTLIAKAEKHYADKGFQRIETPWLVSKETSNITKPTEAIDCTVEYNDKSLVASGEQGFLYQMIKGFIPPGKYQTITPCFRVEQQGLWHLKAFMKLELINTETVDIPSLDFLIGNALVFFRSQLGEYREELELVTVPVNNGIQRDIICRGVELGSYGIRKHEYLHWVYGTGIAEPRFSNLIKSINTPIL